MRIALVWNAPCRLIDITTRYEPYVEGFRELGFETVTVCPLGTETDYPYSACTFTCENQIQQVEFWKKLRCDAAAVITWHRMTGILRTIRDAGMKVLAIGESDAQISPRLHPWSTFRFMTYLQPTIRGKLGAAKFWLQRYCLQADSDHKRLLDNASACDVLAFAGQGAAEEFKLVLSRLGADHLNSRIAWLPYPIPNAFCASSVNTERSDRVIAIGRWDSPQKNGRLLERAARQLAASGSRTKILIVGKGNEDRFVELARQVPTVNWIGPQSRDQVCDLMANSRAVLISSRWESGPIVAWEMLALGGTVIGTPILNLRTLTANSDFGRVSRSHTGRALADAIQGEMAAWENHQRNPVAIAEHWRPLVSPVGVARRMLALLGMREPSAVLGRPTSTG